MTEQTPSQTPAESLSALMDNQASELELMRLLKACDSDPELKGTWARYQIASASLRGDLPGLAPAGFAARLSAALDAEETYTGHPLMQQQPKVATHWWQQLGRAAVAASVAGALIVGVQQYQGDSLSGVQMAADTPQTTKDFNPADLPSGINAPSLSARTVAVQSGYESRPQETRQLMYVPRQENAPVYNEDISTYVNQLIEEHSGNAALNSGQGMLPYTRVILTEED
jgi:sigma-E factor negative regulatory protein RseA